MNNHTVEEVIRKFNNEIVPLATDLINTPDLLTSEEEEEVNTTLNVLQATISDIICSLEYEHPEDIVNAYYYYKNNTDLNNTFIYSQFEKLRNSYHHFLANQLELLKN